MDRARRGAPVVGLITMVGAVFIWLVRPLESGPAASDAASSVLYFERIVSGRTLETWLNTTPKPLLTLVYGVLHALDPSWSLVSLSVVLAAAVGVVLAAEVVRRIAGLTAAVFVMFALVGSVALGAEVAWAYGLPWALLLWSAAALMLLRASPRPGWAGAFLLLAALVRPETFIVLAVGAAMLAFASVREGRPPRRMWLVMVGWLALPIMCLHDLLLTGDPLWWLSVAPHAVTVNGGRARSLAGTILLSVNHLRSMWILVVLACAGGILLVVRRAWVAVAGIVALGPLVFAYTWALSARHIQVLVHYFHPADLAIIVAAGAAVGIAVDAVRTRLGARNRRLAGRPGATVAIVIAGILAVVSAHPYAPLSAAARATIGGEAAIDARVTAVVPTIRANIPARAAAPVRVRGPMDSPDPASVVLFIPAHRLPRMAVDLGLPLTRIAVIDPAKVDLAAEYPPVDSVVYLDGVIDPASVGPRTAVLRVSAPSTIGGVEVVPIMVDPSRKIWIVAIRRAP